MNEQQDHHQRTRLVNELRGVERAAWRGWRRSFESRLVTKVDKGDSQSEMEQRQTRLTGRGDVRFLFAVIRAVERQAALLGLAEFAGDESPEPGEVDPETARAVLDELMAQRAGA